MTVQSRAEFIGTIERDGTFYWKQIKNNNKYNFFFSVFSRVLSPMFFPSFPILPRHSAIYHLIYATSYNFTNDIIPISLSCRNVRKAGRTPQEHKHFVPNNSEQIPFTPTKQNRTRHNCSGLICVIKHQLSR